MTDEPVVRSGDAEERAWHEAIERRLSADHDCSQLAGELTTSGRMLEAEAESAGSSRIKWVVRGLVLVAIPLIVYSELVTPIGAINYGGMGIGAVLMLAGWLSYL